MSAKQPLVTDYDDLPNFLPNPPLSASFQASWSGIQLTHYQDGVGSRFYADTTVTASSAHLLHYYSTRNHDFREYGDGLPHQKLRQAVEYIQMHLGESLYLAEIANQLGMSQYHFCRLFKRSTGMSPHQYLIRQRVEQAKHLLKKPDRTITSVAMECGFANQSHFAKCFRQCTGMNPRQFRKL